MILDLSAIVKCEGAEERFENQVLDLSEFDFGGEQYVLSKPITFDAVFSNIGSGIISMKAHCRYTLDVRCALCAKLFSKDFTLDIDEVLKDDEGESLVVNGKLEIDDIIMTDIFLNLELKHLCREDCKGLCPKCGADQNVGGCGCDKVNYDPRLSALRDLLK